MDSNGETTTMGTSDEDGEKLARAEGRALVRHYLIEVLDALGPRRGQSVEAMRAEQAAVAERLCYMSPQNLRGLLEVALRMAGVFKAGPRQAPAWPEPAQLYAWAFVLQFPPPRSSDYIPSLMRSRLGDQAMTGGWHVQLFRQARRGPPPPVGDYALGKLREEAEDNRRTLSRITERVASGMATPDDQRWLAAWHRDIAEAESLVLAGRAARAAVAASGQSGVAA